MTTQPAKLRHPGRKLFAAVVAIATIFATMTTAASAERKNVTREEVGVGYFYGTFNESPNILLLAGGRAEEFCKDNPDDPFNAEPGSAEGRIISRKDGSVRIKVDDRGQPVHLYKIELPDGPPWIEAVCATYFADGTIPEPFASGHAKLKSRVTIGTDGTVDVFNSVRGTAVGTDCTLYRFRASADLVVENGVPIGNPEDFVKLELREVRD